MRLAIALCACAGCASPRPSAPPPPPAPVAPAPPKAHRGHLLVHAFGKGLLECKPACIAIDDHAKQTKSPRRVGPGRYLLPQGIFDLATHRLTPLPNLDPTKFEYGSLWLLDEATVAVEYTNTHDVVRVSRGGGPFVPLVEPIPPKAGDFTFLPDGRHAFKTAPLMGGPESPYFVDVIAGQKVTLHHVSALGGKPKPLVTRDQILHADFVLGGASIVYWAPGRLDVPKSLRTLLLERVDVATGTVQRLEELTTPFTMRGTPETEHHTPSRFVVHVAYDAGGAERVRVVDVGSGETRDAALGPKETLAHPFNPAHAGNWPWWERRDDDVVVLQQKSDDGVRVRVLAMPGLEPVLETTLPFPNVSAIDWVRD
ncbi:MAG: hypothetical protein JNL79_05055 [Myxococcales bacterium]|nr:hypothetical protein [Myxococcales bacterium]